MPSRCWFVAGSFALSVLLYVDRACISAAKDDVAADLQLTDLQMGWVFAAFAIGYAVCQTPAGSLADKLGPRKLLTGIVVLWSVFTGLTGLAVGFVSLLAIRLLFGAGEAGAFPGIARATYSWVPISERGLVQGINFSGSRLGGALAFPLLAEMIARLGWRASFGVLMGIGIVWAVAWWLLFRDTPEECVGVSETEKAYITSNRQAADAEASDSERPITIGDLTSSGTTWLLCLQYFASNFTFFFALSWFLPFFKKSSGMAPTTAAWYAAVPLIAGAVGNWVSGWLVDWLYRRTGHATARRLPAVIGFVLSSAGLIGTCYSDSPQATIAWFSLAIFGADMTLSPSWTFAIDVGGTQAGLVSGTMNMAGNIGSFVTSMAFPTLLAMAMSAGWEEPHKAFFFVATALNAMAVVCWLLLDPRRKIAANQTEAV